MKSILWFVFTREKKTSMILAGVLKFKKLQKRINDKHHQMINNLEGMDALTCTIK